MTETYYVLRAPYEWGMDSHRVTEREHEAACKRMEDWFSNHEPRGIVMFATPADRGRAEGVYQYGKLLDVEDVPDQVRKLVEKAAEHAIKTWPVPKKRKAKAPKSSKDVELIFNLVKTNHPGNLKVDHFATNDGIVALAKLIEANRLTVREHDRAVFVVHSQEAS